MKEKVIDFGNERVSVLFKKLFFPTLLGMLSMSAVTTIDGIFVGHGVGMKLHEAPEVPNFGPAGHGPRLQPGMTIAVEPMVCAGDWRVKVLKDKWTTVTVDGSLAAHYENTILITDGEPEVLTDPGE